MKKAVRVLAIVFLIATAPLGLWNGARELGHVDGVLQNSVEVADIVWGVVSILVAIGMMRRRPWTGPLAFVWAVSVTYAGTIASFSFSDPTFSQPGTKIGTISAGVSTAVFSALFVWAAIVGSRPMAAAPAQS